MNNQSKEDEKSNKESEYIIFHFKSNNLHFKNINKTSNQKIINNSKNNINNTTSIKEQNKNMNTKKEENFKTPFTNLILREKINNEKFNNFFLKGKKIKLKLSNKNTMSKSNSTKDFLIINKYKTIVNHSNNIKENDNNKTLYKDSKNNVVNNSKENFNKTSYGLIKKNNFTQKVKMVSTGQQTFMEANEINNLEKRQIKYNQNKKKKNKEIVNIPIRNVKNKLTEIITKSENVNRAINNYNIVENNNMNI